MSKEAWNYLSIQARTQQRPLCVEYEPGEFKGATAMALDNAQALEELEALDYAHCRADDRVYVTETGELLYEHRHDDQQGNPIQ